MTTIYVSTPSYWRRSKYYFQGLNLFPSVPPTNDQYELRNQKISTRLFIILLTISLAILLLYTSLATVTKTVIVKTPTLDQYSHLYTEYPETLTCACTKISIDYEKLVNIQYSFHQVCMSDFVTDDWINYLVLSFTEINVNNKDFRWTGTYTFQALRAFCKLMNRTVSDGLDRFYANTYISASVIPLGLFRQQIEASVNQFKSSTTNSFLLSLSIIRDTTLSNTLLSAARTNYYMYLADVTNIYLTTLSRFYSDCLCDETPTCSETSAIYDFPNAEVRFTVPGLYVGCYVIESLLRSSLQCFYNQTCINILQSYCWSPFPINVTALDPSIPSVYFVNSTIQQMVNSLMVEEWNSSLRYASYYAECRPAQCIYTHTTRNDIIYIVTTLIGLVGGLMTVLKLLVPPLVKFVRKKIKPPTSNNGKNKDSAVFRSGNIHVLPMLFSVEEDTALFASDIFSFPVKSSILRLPLYYFSLERVAVIYFLQYNEAMQIFPRR